jgi:hypothetical protein
VKRLIFTIVTVLIGVVVVGGSVVALSAAQEEPASLVATSAGTAETPQGTLPHATVELSILPNTSAEYPGPAGLANALLENNGVIQSEGWPFYWPSTSLTLPAHTLVTITVKQYDGASTPLNPFWAKVHGTVDGTATYNGKALTGIEPAQLAHTFTIHQYPQAGQDNVFLSVPMLAVPNNAKNEANGYPAPQVVEFSFVTPGPGQYIWNCEDPCGDSYQNFGGVMQSRGWMSGTIEVV